MTLFEALTERQRAERWTDEELADEIGISRTYLSFLRSGRKPMTLRVLHKIVARFPEYTDLAHIFLLPNDTYRDIDSPCKEPSRVA